MMFGGIFRDKRVIVTGHTGFKGSWLTTWLSMLGAKVYGYSNSLLNERDNYQASRVSSLAETRLGDVRDLQGLRTFFFDVQPDFAFHLAAQTLVLTSYQDPVETFSTNVMGSTNFLEVVRQTPSLRVAINVTSDKCYDNRELVRGYVESDALGGRDPYSASKGATEIITSSFIRSYFSDGDSCNVGSGRAGNVVGGGDWSPNRIVPDLFKALQTAGFLEIRNPNAVRPWQHVLEPLSGYLLLAARLHQSKLFQGAWNFGPEPGNHRSVADLVKAFSLKLAESNMTIETKTDSRPGPYEASQLRLDISKSMRELEWRPVLNFSETIDFTVQGYLDQIENRDLLECRQQQISLYTRMATQLGLQWAL
jgi:CDP-glucose 4,6-dehydratase